MLEIKNVSLSVLDSGAQKTILDNISLTVPDNKLVVITGPNGSGKSSLAKLIAGINKATAGKVLFNDKDITNDSITDRAREGIAFAFQSPVKFKGIRVKDLICMATGKDLSTADACEYLSLVGLCAKEYIDREVNDSLSGGELKRIEIASVIARKAKLSIFDEPEAGIDLWSFNNLIKVFKKMRSEIKDSSILVISHQERILNIADEIVLIKNGKIEKQGKREDVYPSLRGGVDVSSVCRNGADEEGDECL